MVINHTKRSIQLQDLMTVIIHPEIKKLASFKNLANKDKLQEKDNKTQAHLEMI